MTVLFFLSPLLHCLNNLKAGTSLDRLGRGYIALAPDCVWFSSISVGNLNCKQRISTSDPYRLSSSVGDSENFGFNTWFKAGMQGTSRLGEGFTVKDFRMQKHPGPASYR
ncbi:hypothetical protein PILCRDRAFT_791773 [Piloderma croceum F 1598]|uniref:Uncharacterized protein n=1 Tax=Piloderma croceum (strain F 1598) TaxID=765440 RepID=A0A0C3FI46_PILCF|nr:hypothetical protein PILCRDRAFT_791773 [Piloderma croceum F 1598]